MATKKTMTLNLSPDEMKALEALSAKKELSKTSVLRMALRLYQLIDMKFESGQKLYFEDDEKKEKAELILV